MALTKKVLQDMMKQAAKDAIKEVIKEIRPTIKRTIREEFYKMLDEADSNRSEPQRQIVQEQDELSMAHILSQDVEEDEARQAVQQKIFSGGQFADVLNQTANQYRGRSIGREAAAGGAGMYGINEQKEFVLNTGNVPVANQQIYRSSLIDKMGYGDGFTKVGAKASVPGVSAKPQSALSQIVGKTARKPDRPVSVSLPTKNADGRPINFNNVPADIVQNMMRDYSGTLKKLESRSSFVRGGASGQTRSTGRASLGAFQHAKESFNFEEDKK